MKLNEDEEEQKNYSDKNINLIDKDQNNSSPKENIEENILNEKYCDSYLTTRKWRVKLYRLNEKGQWDDNGIGYVFCIYNKEIIKNELIMVNESTEEEMFKIDINKNSIDFHNQRGTIMTWKTEEDNGNGDDNIAISFQDKEGVYEILTKILICQGKNPNDESYFMDVQSENYYEVSIQNLPNLVRELNTNITEQKLMNFITNLKSNDYKFIKQLGELLREEEKKIENLKTNISSKITNDSNHINTNNEDNNNNSNKKDKDKDNNIIINDNNNNNNEINNEYNQQQIYKDLPMENIHYIFNIFKNLILIGDKDLLEILIEDDYYLITFGALEYDFQTMKTVPHRKYFNNIVKFKNPLNIKDENILKKIYQNLRLTYLRDTALSRLIEDNAIKTINLMLQLNHNDIIQFFLNDLEYFKKLINQLQNEDLNIKKESCFFLSELIECSKDVIQSRDTFMETLFDQGILSVIGKIIEETKNDENENEKVNSGNDNNLKTKELIKITTIEIFINILSIIPNAILDYLKKEKDHILFKQLTNILLYSDNFGIKYEIGQIYKTLIETQKQQTDKMELFEQPFIILLNYLKTPITSILKNNISHKEKMVISSTKQNIIEILITWFSSVNFNQQFWIDENKLNDIISNLLEEVDKVINLYSIKLLKCIIDYTDEFICRKIITESICSNLTKLFNKNIKKNNIIISCMMDFFESLSKNKELIFNNIMTYQSDFFYQNEKYFKLILLRYEKKTIPKRELINFLKNDYKDNESLFLCDFDYKEMGDIYGDDEEKVIDYMNKKREREDFNDNNEEYFDNFSYEHEHKKYNNEYYNRIMFGNKNNHFDNDHEHEHDNEDDIKKSGFLPDLRVNEKHEDNNDDDNNFHF